MDQYRGISGWTFPKAVVFALLSLLALFYYLEFSEHCNSACYSPKGTGEVRHKILLGEEAFFDFAKPKLRAEAVVMFEDRVIPHLGALKQKRVVLIGHADPIDERAVNCSLSLARAEAVKEFLLDRHLVEEKDIKIIGRGEEDRILGLTERCKYSRELSKSDKDEIISCYQPMRRVDMIVEGSENAPTSNYQVQWPPEVMLPNCSLQ